jgi:sigma-B regulation protein RsbU (phosphoserine phosphatase)
LVRAVVNDTESPAETMRRVNALLIPENKESMFVTAIYGRLSLKNGKLTYANAGHNPPLWFSSKDKKLTILNRTGPALGIIEALQMEEQTLTLNPEDFLLLYTDGLTEAFSADGEIFGDERLQNVFGEMELTTANGVLTAIEAAVNQFTGSLEAMDDLTMIGLKRKG